MSRPPCSSTAELVQQLSQQLRSWEQGGAENTAECISSGFAALDAILPQGAFRRGTLVEWLAAVRGSGASSLALRVSARACAAGGALVVVDRRRRFYPPAVLEAGLRLEQLIVVRPASEADHAWAIDQTLRCPAVGAVLCWPEKLDDLTFRRWQLAAETGGVLGLLVRPEAVRREPTWAEVRLLVKPVAEMGIQRRLRVELVRCRGGAAGGGVEVEMRVEG